MDGHGAVIFSQIKCFLGKSISYKSGLRLKITETGRNLGMKRSAFILFVLAIHTPALYAQSSSQPAIAPEPAKQIDSEAKISIEPPRASFPISEEVKILRAERRSKMPYLDKGYIKETINKKTIQSKAVFSERGGQTLKDVVARAVEVYTPARAAKERISLARRKILVAAREFLPGTDFNFEFRDGSLSGDAFTGSDYHAVFRMPIFRGGILWNTFQREKSEYRAAKKEYDAVLNELVNEVAKAYFEYNRAREVLRDKKEASGESRKQQSISKQKFEQSLISEIEYLNVESMSGQIQYDVETSQQEFELAKLELQRYLNLDIGDNIDIAPLYDVDMMIKHVDAKGSKATPAYEKNILSQPLDEFIDLAYQNRPELQVEAAHLHSGRLEEKIAQGAFLPRADVTMEFGELGEAFTRNTLKPDHHYEWHFGLEVSQNLFGNKMKWINKSDQSPPSISQFLQGTGSTVNKNRMEMGLLNGLQDYAELKEAQVRKLERVVELEKKEREVIREVKEAYFDYQKAKIQVESSLKRNQYRSRLVELSKVRLSKAEIEISEYLQAWSDLSEERKKLHGALADLYKAKSKLNRSIGIRDFLPMEEQYGS